MIFFIRLCSVENGEDIGIFLMQEKVRKDNTKNNTISLFDIAFFLIISKKEL